MRAFSGVVCFSSLGPCMNECSGKVNQAGVLSSEQIHMRLGESSGYTPSPLRKGVGMTIEHEI